VSRQLADVLKRGISPSVLPEAIREAEELAKKHPSVGWPFRKILEQIARKWEPYESSGIPADEYERVRDTVCPRMVDILGKLAERPGYDPSDDVRDLVDAYDAI